MKNRLCFSSAAILVALAPAALAGAPRAELDAFWATVSQAVAVGDFATYAACCHPDGVLVSEAKGLSQPFAAAFERWKPEFADTRAGRMAATVEFRFTRRLGDATSAHETGIFRYTSKVPGEAARIEHVPFEALLVKRDGRWLMLMEHQKAHVGAAEWDALAPDPPGIVEITPDTVGQEVSRYYSLHAHGPTKKFYSFPDRKIVVVVQVNPARADAIETTALVHVFPANADPAGIDRWINNQHSDALYADAAAPVRSIKVDPERLHAKATGPLGHEVGGNGDEYDRYRIDFTIDGFTDGDLTMKPSQGSAAAFVRTKDLTPR
jgi:hypothetical protein